MPAEQRDPLGGLDRAGEGGLREEHSSLDELARGLAIGALSRRQAMKMAGAAFLGGALSFFSLSRPAQAKRRRRRLRCSPGSADTQAGSWAGFRSAALS